MCPCKLIFRIDGIASKGFTFFHPPAKPTNPEVRAYRCSFVFTDPSARKLVDLTDSTFPSGDNSQCAVITFDSFLKPVISASELLTCVQ